MRPVLKQTVTLPASAERLFDMYLDPAAHAAFTGHDVTIDSKAGAPFQAFGGQLHGHVITTLRPRLIVQSWRSVNFHDGDPDSTLLLNFSDVGDKGQIDLIHLDVPAHEQAPAADGWETHYWKPWQAYLAG
jgi:activator of HSP90 ATPase